MHRPSLVLAALLVVAAPALTACQPRVTGFVGVTRDADGALYAAIAVCDGDVDRVTLSRVDSPDAWPGEVIGTWTRSTPERSFALVRLEPGEVAPSSAWSGSPTEPLRDGPTYYLRADTVPVPTPVPAAPGEDTLWSNLEDYSFELRDLADLEPGSVVWSGAYTPYQRPALVEFRPEQCDGGFF